MNKLAVFAEARRAAWLSVWTLFGIGVAEVSISAYTGSLTLLADGLDSMADALVSFIVWFGIRMLHKPRNKLFHFGYAKIESFAAFIAAIIIVILGIFIVYQAYEHILHPSKAINPEITMITLLAAGSISLHRAFVVRKIAKKHNLISLNLDAKNSIKDGSASFVGFGSVLAGYFGVPYMDAIGGIIIAGYIFFMAYTAIKESTLVLLDAVKNPELQETITKFVETEFNVEVEDVLVRPLGHALSIQVHIFLDRSMTLDKVNDIVNKMQDAVGKKFEAEETLIIPDPR
ncbi:MAG: cation diffusion facilitator family transporter [Thaumarchaeota archaeon]|nr:cation diffusion facilitator family transporter [Nitrososphaerota archaeon]